MALNMFLFGAFFRETKKILPRYVYFRLRDYFFKTVLYYEQRPKSQILQYRGNYRTAKPLEVLALTHFNLSTFPASYLISFPVTYVNELEFSFSKLFSLQDRVEDAKIIKYSNPRSCFWKINNHWSPQSAVLIYLKEFGNKLKGYLFSLEIDCCWIFTLKIFTTV